MSEDRNDKNNPYYNFTPQVDYSPQVKKAADELVKIINDKNLSESERKSAIWLVLNQQSQG
jgi:hypothetical protein